MRRVSVPHCNFSSESRRQQILAFEASLLPLRLVSFMGSMAEAAKSCFQGAVAAFVLGGFIALETKAADMSGNRVSAAFVKLYQI